MPRPRKLVRGAAVLALVAALLATWQASASARRTTSLQRQSSDHVRTHAVRLPPLDSLLGLLPIPPLLGSPSNPVIDPSGQAAPSGDIPGWHQVFMDNFPNAVARGNFPDAVASRWGAYTDGWHDTSGRGTYSCTKVCSVHNGVLDLYLHSENGVPYVATPYPIIPGNSSHNGQRYGRYAIRFKSDAVPGHRAAWLLWPDSETWPRDGEIDFPEAQLTHDICGFVHHQGATWWGDQDPFCTQTPFASGWHTAITEWTPSYVNFILDGRTIGTARSRLPNTPMHWVLQTETTPGASTADIGSAGHVQIDWVAVYRPA